MGPRKPRTDFTIVPFSVGLQGIRQKALTNLSASVPLITVAPAIYCLEVHGPESSFVQIPLA